MSTVAQGTNANKGGPTIKTTAEKYTTVGELLQHNAPENRDLLVKSYGEQGITGFLNLTGAVTQSAAADHVQWWEEERRHKTLGLDAESSGTSSSGTITVTAGVEFSNLQDVVMNADNGEVFICTAVHATTPANGGITFNRLNGGSSATAWVEADKLILLGNMYDQGSDQPDHFYETSPTKRTNPFMIVKDTFKVNGSQATNVGYVNVGNGDYRWFIHGEQETSARFGDKREMMMLFGEKQSDETKMTDGGKRFPAGSEGYFAAIADRGITATGGENAAAIASMEDLDAIITVLDKQGAPSEYAMYVNRKQDLAIDDMLATGIATQVTAGLPGQFGAFNNSPDMAVQLGFKSFTRGGYTFHKHDWKLLNDPTLLGASKIFQGAMCPMTQVADARTGLRSPALELNYKAANGVSRDLEHWLTGGGPLVPNKTDGSDNTVFNYRSEIALVTRAANQHVVIKGS